MKQFDASKETFSRVLALTEKNEDTKTRANNYALMAELYWRQLNNKVSASYYLEKALSLDSSNAGFIIQKGDAFYRKEIR